jgi:hypothetical protein
MMVRTHYLIMGLLAVLIGFAMPNVTQSDWMLDSCIEACRSSFDPDKDMTDYTDCVENCKSQHPDGSSEEP